MLTAKVNPATGDRGAQKETTSWWDGAENNRHARTSKARPPRCPSACRRRLRRRLRVLRSMTKFHLLRSGADERETLMNAPAIKHTTAPAPLDVLALRAWARALLLAEGEIASVAEAVDPLQAFAVASGLVAQIGADAVQQIIAQQFRQRLRYEPAA